MPLLKVRCMPHLKQFRRAGLVFYPQATIVDVDDEKAASIKGDTRSLIAESVTKEEAEAFAASQVKAISDPDAMAAENVALRQEQAKQAQRIAELEDAVRGLLAERGDSFGGEEPTVAEGRGVKPSIAPGRQGKGRGE